MGNLLKWFLSMLIGIAVVFGVRAFVLLPNFIDVFVTVILISAVAIMVKALLFDGLLK